MKIRTKIILGFMILVLILIAVAASAFYYISKKSIEQMVYNTATAKSRANTLELWIDARTHETLMLSQDDFTEGAMGALAEGKLSAEQAQEVTQALKEIAETDQRIYSIMILDKSGAIVISTLEEDIGKDKSMDSYFLGAKEGVFIKGPYISPTLNKDIITVSAPIIDSETKEFLGVLVQRRALDDLYKILTDTTGLGKTGETFLINQYGYMISPSRFLAGTFLKMKIDTTNSRDCLARLHNPELTKKYLGISMDYRGMDIVGTNEAIPPVGWCLLSEMDASEAFAPLIKIEQFMAIFALAFLIISAILLWYGSGRITKPILELHKAVEFFATGNLSYRTKIKTGDEIEQLGEAFNSMAAGLEKAAQEHKKYTGALEKEITNKTKELQDKLYQLETFARVSTGRELKMFELKEKIKKLEEEKEMLMPKKKEKEENKQKQPQAAGNHNK